MLIDPSHGLKSTDEQLLSLLRQHGIAHQVLLSKADRLLSPKRKLSQERLERNRLALDEVCVHMRAKIQPGAGDGPDALGELICCSSEAPVDGKKLGVMDLRWAILAAVGLGVSKHAALLAVSPPNASDTSNAPARDTIC